MKGRKIVVAYLLGVVVWTLGTVFWPFVQVYILQTHIFPGG